MPGFSRYLPRLALRLTAALALMAWVAGCAATPADDAARLARVEAMADEYRAEYPEVPELTVDEVLADPALLRVDVRSAEEQAVSRIPRAVTREEFEAASAQYVGRRVVTYCTIGYRSGVYAAELRARGIDAHNLRGSILAWAHAGAPLLDSSGAEILRIHVYGKRWDLAPLNYETVY